MPHKDQAAAAAAPDERALRRLALQVAVQLPENERDALMVLRFAAELVSGWLQARAEPATLDPGLRLVER